MPNFRKTFGLLGHVLIPVSKLHDTQGDSRKLTPLQLLQSASQNKSSRVAVGGISKTPGAAEITETTSEAERTRRLKVQASK